MKISLDELQSEYDRLLRRARPSTASYTLQTERGDDGSPHVEIVGDEIHYVTTERGLELSRDRYADEREFLYAAVSLVTFFMGVDHEFRNRIGDQDCRRIIFAKQIELLKLIDPDWARRRAIEIEETLRVNPYNDCVREGGVQAR